MRSYAKAKGFGHSLDKTETEILLCFDENGKCVYPAVPLLEDKELRRYIARMRLRGFITGASPYRLTKLGARLRKQLDMEQ